MSVFTRALAFALLFTPGLVLAQSDGTTKPGVSLELNAVQDVEGACRFTFVAGNSTSTSIDKAVFETVIFDTEGAVVRLSLFDFRALPEGRPRVRQFDVPGMACDLIGQALINGTNSCIVNGAESGVCGDGLTLTSRITMKLLG
ncbi:hypothetical protein [uncultured Shimia sp.]|uniref:hypothetical protein n=1 Tax=uncultured Shimia sp. TaxID=573152 RepID=UPI0026355479|nr:hypothetical protein [uncultured Shimia sp.]